MNSTTRDSKGAIIHEFKSNAIVIERGGNFTLTWKVEADQIDLYRNGTFFQTLGTSQQSLEKSEFYDSDKDVTYELVAIKNGIQARSKPVVIRCAISKTNHSIPDFSKDILQFLPWTKFISITCLVIALLIIITGLIIAESFSIVLLTLIPGLLLLLPNFVLLRFSLKVRQSSNKDYTYLSDALKLLKLYFKLTWMAIILFFAIGVLTFIILLIKQNIN
jgi:hypothetical protein